MSAPPSDDDPKDGEPGARADDPDRAAILARRQRFIALALSGLATAACDKPASGGPSQPADSSQQGGQADPQPCLKVAAPDPPQADGSTTAVPQPCLDVAIDPKGDSSGDSSGGGDDATPQPCLNVVAPPIEPEPEPVVPQPCLKVVRPVDDPPTPPPQPCLRVAKPPPEPPEEPAKPRPCLKIAKPRD